MLGITHVERNGHHYFRGLSMYDARVQADVLRAHEGFYRKHDEGFPTLDIRSGLLDVSTLHAAPFACGARLDMALYEPLNAWIKRGGISEL